MIYATLPCFTRMTRFAFCFKRFALWLARMWLGVTWNYMVARLYVTSCMLGSLSLILRTPFSLVPPNPGPDFEGALVLSCVCSHYVMIMFVVWLTSCTEVIRGSNPFACLGIEAKDHRSIMIISVTTVISIIVFIHNPHAYIATSDTGVCEKHTPLDDKTGGDISFQKTKSGAGLQFLLLDCKARARTRGMFFFTDAGM